MGLKKKLGMGVASLALGLSLVGAGTYAYFNDEETTNNTFAAGTLDLSLDPETIIDVDNMKPGDRVYQTFYLGNDGSLDISKVLLETDYEVVGDEDNSEDLGEHIEVTLMRNITENKSVVTSKRLAELKEVEPDIIQNLESGQSNKFMVQLKFVDNGEDQNEFQGDSLKLKWKFDAQQTEGSAK